MKTIYSRIVVILGIILFWEITVQISGVEHFILPGPYRVFQTLIIKFPMILQHSIITGTEMLIGLTIGSVFGFFLACVLGLSKPLSKAMLPVLVISQALPVFAIAPILMLWFGYGMGSKIIMTTLIVFFPITLATLNGFSQIPSEWLNTLQLLSEKKIRIFFYVELLFALPHAVSGLRIAASITPIGAVVGEWVGSSGGLGYLMLYANGRGQTDLMFASLTMLIFLALALWWLVNLAINSLKRFGIKQID